MATKNTIQSILHNAKPHYEEIENADGTNTVDLAAVSAGNSALEEHIYSIQFSNDEAANTKIVQLSIYDGTRSVNIGNVSVPASSGISGIDPINALVGNIPLIASRVLKDQRGNYFVPLFPGETLRMAVTVAMTAGKKIYAQAIGWNFERS